MRPLHPSHNGPSEPDEEEEVNLLSTTPIHLKRKLKSRHLTMIAIGGIIGPGLFVGSGSALHTAGPAGILLAFSVTGFITFCVMQSLGEMASYIPVSGSLTDYASRFGNEALGFSLGYNYFWLWITVLANEYNNVSFLMQYWTETVPQWVWIVLFWFIFMFCANLGVLVYGEVEFWLSTIKILALIIFFLLAALIDVGIIGGDSIGFRYWRSPGAFANGINGVAEIFAIAGALYAGCEMVGVTAGESADPTKAVPKAIRQVFWRILIFYIGGVFFIGLLVPSDHPDLLQGSSKTAQSPMTIALSKAGLGAAASIVNAIIILSVISAANSALYVASRSLWYLATQGKAPRLFAEVKNGVPYKAVLFSNLLGLISLMKFGTSSGKVFEYLIRMSGVSTFIAWGVICLSHIRFRRGLAVQNISLQSLPFLAWGYPYTAYFGLFANIILIIFQGYTTFLPFDFSGFVSAYISLVIFIGLYLIWKSTSEATWTKYEKLDLKTDACIIDKRTANTPKINNSWHARIISSVVG